MKITKSFENRVVVITGASSGIGRATAVAFAERSASVVLAARRERALRHVAEECQRAGARTLVVPTDVTDAAAMERLAARAIDAFGEIDVWINNAGVGLFGPFINADVKIHRRVVETNLFGTMNGAAAVLPHFLRQRRGVLITNISIGGWAPVPFASAYTASKFGMRGFLASLRQELSDVPGVRVCGVFPASIDTPGYQHGANVSAANIRPAPPLFPPEAVARTLVALAARPRDEVAVGWPARVAQISYAVAPALTERLAGRVIRRSIEKNRTRSSASPTQGNLFLPVSAGTRASGGWLPPTEPLPRVANWAAGGLLALGLGLFLSRHLDRETKLIAT